MESLKGVHKPRLVIDASSIVKACAFVRHEEDETQITFEGKTFNIQDPLDIFETFKGSLIKTLTELRFRPADIIFVKDPINSRGNRLKIYPEYKAKRQELPPEWFESYNKALADAEKLILDYGGIIATPKEGYEADDLIAEIAERFRHTIIWTRDRDLQCLSKDVFLEGILNPPHPSGLLDPNHIKLWKVLVSGDSSDNVPSVKGFGPKRFGKLIETFGGDGLDALAELLENDELHRLEEDLDEFPDLQMILDDAETAYTAWELYKFQHVPAYKIKWQGGVQKMRFEPGMETWWPTKTLVTDINIADYADKISKALHSADHVALDIETDTPPESKEWLRNNGEKIDVFGSELAGCGLTAGPHSFYFSINHKDTANVILEDLKTVLGWIPEDTPILCHQAGGFELPILYRTFNDPGFGDHGFLPNVHDTKIAANYVDEVMPTGLKSLSKRYLKYHQLTYEETLGEASGMFELTGKQVIDYGLDDTICTDALWNLYTAIMEYEGTLDVFVEVEQTCQYTAALAMHKGVRCDLDKVKELAEKDREVWNSAWKKFRKYLMDLEWTTKELQAHSETGKSTPVSIKHRWPGTYFEPLTELNGAQIKRMHAVLYGLPFKTQIRKLEKLAEFFTEKALAEAIASGDLARVNAEYEARWLPEPVFNVNSPADCSLLMYEAFNLPVRVRNKPTPKMTKEGKPGSPSTDEDAIENAIAFGDVGDAEELFRTLLQLKKISTRFSLFYDKYSVLVHWKDGRLHPQLRQSATSTRRFGHGGPNLAQLPKKKGKELRSIIAADNDDYVICKMDIDSQELKIQAWDCQDDNFLSCYLGEDKKNLHSLTGYGIDQRKEKKWTTYEEFQAAVDAKDEEASKKRHQGKETNFSTSYLCRAKKLGILLRVSEEEAQEFMDAKALAFPRLMPYVDEYIEVCKDQGYSLTFLGGRRHLHVAFAINDKFWQAKAGRWSWSFRVQGSAAEQTKLIMRYLWESGIFFEYECYPVTSVHDEIVLVIHKADLEQVIPIAKDCVCRDYDGMEIPTTSTPEIGPNYADCMPYEIKFLEEQVV